MKRGKKKESKGRKIESKESIKVKEGI